MYNITNKCEAIVIHCNTIQPHCVVDSVILYSGCTVGRWEGLVKKCHIESSEKENKQVVFTIHEEN